MPGIIWLATYPKSGNTWLRAFLANYIENPEAPLDINELPGHVYGDGLKLPYAEVSGRPAEDLSGAELAALRGRVQAAFLTDRQRDIFVKTHNRIAVVDGHPLIAPEVTVGAIYVLRNPLDVAVSWAHHFQVPLDRAVAALTTPDTTLPADSDTVPQHVGGWGQHLASWTGTSGLILHVLRYEDMLQQPIKAFGSVVKFLDLPPDRPRLKKAIDFASFRELQRQETDGRFVEGHKDGRAFFRAGKVGAWRDTLNARQVERILKRLGPAMKAHGYLDAAGRPRGI